MATRRANRTKISTTVAPETYSFLEQKVRSGEAATLAEAIDQLVRRLRRLENRQRLAAATARYFDELAPHAAAEETQLGKSLSSAAGAIDFDQER
jgi:Arc/MetJ-type ribon-helix-helix transcriptional regulator